MRIRRNHLFLVFGFLLLFWAVRLSAQVEESAGLAHTNYITLAEGKVEIQKAGEPAWAPAARKQVLAGGDRLRTGEKSRAQVYLASGMTISVDEYGEIGIPKTQGISARRGILRIFSREKQPGTVFELPSATAALRGTDFLIRIGEGDSVQIVVFDGAMDLANAQGSVSIRSGEEGASVPGERPRTFQVDLQNPDYAQWSFYYPAVLDLREFSLPPEIAVSTNAYLQGDLPGAIEAYDWNRTPGADGERVYRAHLLLSLGHLDQARQELHPVSEDDPGRSALEILLAAVRGESLGEISEAGSASVWLALSYYEQSRARLDAALRWARAALGDGSFAFAHARVAELEFSFGRNREALLAVNQSLALAPRNAHALVIKGFLESSRQREEEAFVLFDRAIALDAAYGNAWLGRGLIHFRRGEEPEGLRDLLVAASLEPRRSILRSYLAKGFQQTGDLKHALHDLRLARNLDPNDPTPWLYQALIEHLTRRINPAIRSLEHSQTLNTNRAVFRSAFLLDQDQAARSANLAAIYQDAGLSEVAVTEAGRAVQSDYGNFSAHLFLANSYNALRDPAFGSLRYETATFSEYLVANLLAPPGAARLSPQISQQEYSRLFEQNRLGFAFASGYLSEGDWSLSGVQYGHFDRTSYALEGSYRLLQGEAPNRGLDEKSGSIQFKQGLSPSDDIYLQATYSRLKTGDTRQVYDPFLDTSAALRYDDEQEPNLFAGYHHEWAPGTHLLLLLASLNDRAQVEDDIPLRAYTRRPDRIEAFGTDPFPFDLAAQSEFRALVAEGQLIRQLPRQTLVLGSGWQGGEIRNDQQLLYTGGNSLLRAFKFSGATTDQELKADLNRVKVYAYDYWQIVEPLTLSAGLGFDHLEFPEGTESRPMVEGDKEKNQLSPKAGLLWEIHPTTRLKAAYSHSLGGVFYENSVRLEPTQLAGYNQAFRSLAPESAVGSIPGAEFQVLDFGSDSKFSRGTYLGWQAELLRSEGDQRLGILDTAATPAVASSLRREVAFEERSLSVYANQLVGDYFSLGIRYRIAQSDARSAFPELDPFFAGSFADEQARLEQFEASVHFNHPSGVFGVAEAISLRQKTAADLGLPEENLWQFNLLAGYRFPRRRAEVLIGLLNLGDQDYRLHPLNLHPILPRGRSVLVNLRINL